MPLMLASCNPHPNWMPINPKLMLKICQKLKRGFCICSPPGGAVNKAVFVPAMPSDVRKVSDLPARTFSFWGCAPIILNSRAQPYSFPSISEGQRPSAHQTAEPEQRRLPPGYRCSIAHRYLCLPTPHSDRVTAH